MTIQGPPGWTPPPPNAAPSPAFLSLADAERIADQTQQRLADDEQVARLDTRPSRWRAVHARLAVERERVTSDLDGLRDALDGLALHEGGIVCRRCSTDEGVGPCSDSRRYARAAERASGTLLRTAALYGATP